MRNLEHHPPPIPSTHTSSLPPRQATAPRHQKSQVASSFPVTRHRRRVAVLLDLLLPLFGPQQALALAVPLLVQVPPPARTVLVPQAPAPATGDLLRTPAAVVQLPVPTVARLVRSAFRVCCWQVYRIYDPCPHCCGWCCCVCLILRSGDATGDGKSLREICSLLNL